MPPHSPPPALLSNTYTVAFIFLGLFFIDLTMGHPCYPERSCPPWTSRISFPFASSPGCGHPSFQIQCFPNHSTISINNFSFVVLRHEHQSSSLFLLPEPPVAKPSQLSCSSATILSIPNRSINLSGSPFRFSDAWRSICSLDKLGIQVDWDEKNDDYFKRCKGCQAIDGVCGFNSSNPRKPFLCFCRDNTNRIALFCSISIFLCLLLVVLTATVIFRFRWMKSPATEEDPTAAFLHRHKSADLLPPVFSYEELETSTNRFDPRNKIGDGGFGSVYIGLLYDGRIAAVKRLHRRQQSGRAALTKAFCNEILILSSIDHPNLVRLHGYCSDPRGLVLVYDYVPNGTLADHLHGSKSLNRKASSTWQVRVNVALQTAMALEYLHFSVTPAIVHRDITSSNIFMEKDMRVKVGDFGLSRLLVFPESSLSSSSLSSSSGSVWTGPQGTPGYLDPDYHRSFRLTEKSDIYSLGVVLFELISGMKAVDVGREKREVALADLVVSKIQAGSLHQVVDQALILEGEVMETVDAVAELAFRCVAGDKDDRPDAKEVVAELKRICDRIC